MLRQAAQRRTTARAPRPERTSRPRRAAARICTHFGEFLQGKFSTEGGPIRALVTAPCPLFQSVVTVEPTMTPATIETIPPGLFKAATAARNTLGYLGIAQCGATVTVESNIIPGIGAGSSTGDVVATIQATADAFARVLSPEEIAILAVETEQAIDPSMFSFSTSRVRLFAHRTGRIIENFDGQMPRTELLGIVDGAPVDTLCFAPAIYCRRLIREFDGLREAMRAAVKSSDAAAFGAVTTRSAEINEAFLPKPRFKTWERLLDRHGAVGLAVSHSGSALAFLFDRDDEYYRDRIEELRGELAAMKVELAVQFRLGKAKDSFGAPAL